MYSQTALFRGHSWCLEKIQAAIKMHLGGHQAEKKFFLQTPLPVSFPNIKTHPSTFSVAYNRIQQRGMKNEHLSSGIVNVGGDFH